MGQRNTAVAVAVVAVGLAFTGCSSSPAAEPTPTPAPTERSGPRFDAAALACGLTSYSEVLDDGEAIELKGIAQSPASGAQIENLECFLEAFDAPETVLRKVEQTRALDGRQAEEWEGYSMEWTYHPDDGASIIIERRE